MEVSVRELKARLSEYLRKLKPGEEITVTSHGKPVGRLLPPRSRQIKRSAEEEAIEFLRRQPWIRPGKPGKPRLPKPILRIEPGEQTLSEIVIEQRGER
jgi:prevent-host-death family protein